MSADLRGQTSAPPFESSKLLGQYQVIGAELCSYESQNSAYGHLSVEALMAFREGVVFIPVEVLESYLEDLLDLKFKEDQLFIYRERSWFQIIGTFAVWLTVCILAGLFCSHLGLSSTSSITTALSLAIFIAVLWFFATRNSLLRRIGFARVLSYEISRRRGRDEDGRSHTGTVLGNFLRSGRMKGLSETARVMSPGSALLYKFPRDFSGSFRSV